MRSVETIIVGGGPGGSSSAWELRRRGRECLVLERKPMPRLKLCAGWVTPKVLADLAVNAADYPHGMVKLESLKVFFGAEGGSPGQWPPNSIRSAASSSTPGC